MSDKKTQILVVEDENVSLELLVLRLENEGYGVTTARDGEEGLKLAREEKPDIILLDLMLPKLDGFKLCRMLKFDNRYKHIPVIILSALAEEKDLNLGGTVGADDYVTKPFDWNSLQDKISRLLKKSEDRRGPP